MLTAALPSNEPATFEQAMNSPEKDLWLKAAKEEYDLLIENKTWRLENLPAGRKVIEGKWVFRRKFNQDGSVDRYKARFVVRGFRQVSGVDYLKHEIFSPIVRIQTVRFLLALTAELNLELKHLDVCTAFLYGDLKEEMYVKQSLGFKDKKNLTKVCRLLKSLYGLKQPPKHWYEKIDFVLLDNGFIHCESDPNLYILLDETAIVLLAVYVDYLILAASTKALVSKVKDILVSQFKKKLLGDLNYCLGVQVVRNRSQGTVFIKTSIFMTF